MQYARAKAGEKDGSSTLIYFDDNLIGSSSSRQHWIGKMTFSPMSHLITEMTRTSLPITMLFNCLSFSFHSKISAVIFTVLYVGNTWKWFTGRYFDDQSFLPSQKYCRGKEQESIKNQSEVMPKLPFLISAAILFLRRRRRSSNYWRRICQSNELLYFSKLHDWLGRPFGARFYS